MPAKTHTTLFLLLIIFSSLILSCKKSNPVEPEELKPGRRDYEWTVDTMMPTPFNMLTMLWGDAEDNVWAIGGAGDFDKVIWHYNGEKWSTVPNSQYVDPNCIFGFNGANIWIGGTWGCLWQYKEGSWSKIDELKLDKFPNIVIENIWGESSSNIYAVGIAFTDKGDDSRAVLMHFDGKAWNLIKIPDIKGSFYDIRKDIKGNGLYFISSYLWDPMGPADSSRIFSFDGSNLKEVYRGLDNENESAGIFTINQKVYIKIGKKLYDYKNNELVIWKDMSNTNYLGRLWGRSERDFFYVTKDKGIGHYNGTDFVKIFNYFPAPASAVITESAVFFLTFDSQGRNIFLKGKLK